MPPGMLSRCGLFVSEVPRTGHPIRESAATRGGSFSLGRLRAGYFTERGGGDVLTCAAMSHAIEGLGVGVSPCHNQCNRLIHLTAAATHGSESRPTSGWFVRYGTGQASILSTFQIYG